ncbi:uncharacterized protein LOC107366438 isoform X2 [Tetranychus urticae]|uniref:uncharacterized protein LOC107366438 isoform X2 n=1 Tax=Tetranychus urticae TaxID=32264 RepID=UPI00077BD87F|nr:uncharacterized protein LOC107366438 isoform X2 [Tetranychus urticae]
MSYTDYSSETDDASDNEVVMERYEDGNYLRINRRANIPDWIYQDRLAKLYEEIRQVREGTHPVCVALIAECSKEMNERLIAAKAYYDNEREKINKEYIRRKEAIEKELEAAKVAAKEKIRAELMEKMKTLESEYAAAKKSLETYTTTKKLQKSPNDAA